MNKVVIFLGVIVLLMVVNLGVLAQPTHLTDRELLIQLMGKLEFIEKSVRRIENHSEEAKRNMIILEKQVTRNEVNIGGFYDKLEDLSKVGLTLLVLFAGFIIGIFAFMWRKSYSGKLVKGSK